MAIYEISRSVFICADIDIFTLVFCPEMGYNSVR